MKKRPKHDARRGRHRKHVSRETQRWNEELLLPERPPWMAQETYTGLARLRDRL